MESIKKVFFRKAQAEDLDLYFEWANDEMTRKNSFSTQVIDYKEHTNWFLSKIRDKNTLMLVFEDVTQKKIGQVRIERKATENVIGISIDKNFRGKGFASTLINRASEEFFKLFDEKSILAYIKKSNVASRNSFERAAYIWQNDLEIQGIESIVLERKND